MVKENNVLDFNTLEITKHHLQKAGFYRLKSELERILKYNNIQKLFSNGFLQHNTTYYEIDLTIDDISIIVDMFADLEVSALDINYDTTRNASYFAKLLDKWNNLPSYK